MFVAGIGSLKSCKTTRFEEHIKFHEYLHFFPSFATLPTDIVFLLAYTANGVRGLAMGFVGTPGSSQTR